MKIHIDRLVLILFVLAMFFFMTVSAKAETGLHYQFSNVSLKANTPFIDDDYLKVSSEYDVNPEKKERQIYGKSLNYSILIGGNTTFLDVNAKCEGILMVYYARGNASTEDFNLKGVTPYSTAESVTELYQEGSLYFGVKFFKLAENGLYKMTSSSQCRVYDFVFMPGKVAAYDVKGKGDLGLIGCFCDSYNNLEKPRQMDNWYLEGWYKDATYREKVTSDNSFDSPSVIYGKWVRCVWDFMNVSNNTQEYDGITIEHYSGASSDNSTSLSPNGFSIFRQPSSETDKRDISFVPQYDGELTVTFCSNASDDSEKECVIGTALPSETNSIGAPLSSGTSSSSQVKTVQAKLKKGQTYYVYTTTGNIKITKLQYIAGAASAQVSEDGKVTLTTTDNMQGWRAFYDADNSYTADLNTKVYIVEQSEADGKVMFVNRTKQTIPAGCPVVLHTEYKNDGSYTISLEKASITDNYAEAINGNLLSASIAGESVNAYRLGYKAGEDFGVAFYKWSSDNPNAGIVYLDKNKLKNNSESAKIAFDIEEDVSTGVISIPNQERANNKVYSLSGQQLTAPVKGVNIFNGKKIVVR